LKDFAKILLYLLGAVLFGALLAPPLWWAGHLVADIGPLGFLAETPFQRYFNRAVLVAALGLLWPLVRSIKLPGWSAMGIAPDRRRWARIGAGLVIGVAAVAVLGLILLQIDLYKIKKEIPWNRVTGIFLSAFVIAALEEFFFRGALLGIIRRSAPDRVALAVVSALYAAVHFIKPADQAVDAVVWSSAFPLIPAALHRFSEPLVVAGGFTTLFAMGWILGDARLRTGTLWVSFGLHAGLVIGKFGFNKIAKRRGELPPWFTDDLLVGLGPLIAVLAAGVAIRVWLAYVDARSDKGRA
jgi:membrane protease YdiL (CAAX protease family)